MPQIKRIEEIEKLCQENGLNIYEVFRKAQIPTSTIFNWKKSNPGAFDTYDKLIDAIEEMKTREVRTCPINPKIICICEGKCNEIL
jgi:predicted transcriptional regulator